MNTSEPDSIESLVEQAYRWILGRHGDPTGVAHHAARLRSGDISMSQLRYDFISCDEFARNFAARPIVPYYVQTELLFIRGTSCVTSNLIKTLGLKTESYPFDWLFCCADMIADCLEDRFATFLNKRYHVSTPIAKDPTLISTAPHTASMKKDMELPINHRDVTEPNNLAYYQRCVERFLYKLDSAGSSLLLMISPFAHTSPQAFRRLSDLLPNSNSLISINLLPYSPSVDNMGFEMIDAYGGNKLVNYRPTSHLYAGLHFENKLDEVVLSNLVWQHVR